MVLVTKKQKTQPIHHRKRHGAHHKRTKEYEKHYWPYLPLFGIVGISLVFNLLWTPLSHSVLSYATNTSTIGLLEATNLQRTKNGESKLAINSRLNSAAQAKANDMAKRDYWSHTTPDGAEPWTFVTNAGYSYLAVGENLAYGFDSSDTTVTGWMNSPGHRANILNAAFREVGFGIANAADYQGHGPETIVVAFYGKSAAQPAAAAATPPAATPKRKTATAAPAPAPTKASPAPAPKTAATPAPAAPTKQPAAVAAANATPGEPTGSTTANAPQRVTRLQAASASLPAWGIPATFIVIMAAAALFITRHLRFVHRYLVKGEQYIIKHPTFDLLAIAVIALGALLTRTAGFIN